MNYPFPVPNSIGYQNYVAYSKEYRADVHLNKSNAVTLGAFGERFRTYTWNNITISPNQITNVNLYIPGEYPISGGYVELGPINTNFSPPLIRSNGTKDFSTWIISIQNNNTFPITMAFNYLTHIIT
ncbi:hypothetical protein [Paenibacillus sp. MMS20-IR301]|uniref:hypothetical protein n=1 Tax=Paenibacillus sp. MMS20-IR301 TaxID=2895946 RepID=UPI0028F08DA5|nr:hypothetical protein [Paenibacillus sp. MMS20-IR301]WNS46460.1 hypothetical protein LOS79_14760 [Paenibacillus sp. MMS20-IR301]